MQMAPSAAAAAAVAVKSRQPAPTIGDTSSSRVKLRQPTDGQMETVFKKSLRCLRTFSTTTH